MFKFVYGDEEFTIKELVIYNSDGEKVTEGQAKELASYYLKTLDFNNMDKQMLYDGIRFAYANEDLEDIPKLVRIYFDREDVEGVEKKVILPKLIEVYRRLGDPRKAVNMFKYIREFYGDFLLSTEFVAEVAEAFCDMQKYEEARMMCEWAYTLRKADLDPIAKTYNRIKKETGEL